MSSGTTPCHQMSGGVVTAAGVLVYSRFWTAAGRSSARCSGVDCVPRHGGGVDADEVGVAVPLAGVHRVGGEAGHRVGEPVGVRVGVGADGRGGAGGAAGRAGAGTDDDADTEQEPGWDRHRCGGADEKCAGAHTRVKGHRGGRRVTRSAELSEMCDPTRCSMSL